MERMTAENIFFHSQCFKCDHCGVKLRTTNYSVDKTSYGDGKLNLCMLGHFLLCLQKRQSTCGKGLNNSFSN